MWINSFLAKGSCSFYVLTPLQLSSSNKMRHIGEVMFLGILCEGGTVNFNIAQDLYAKSTPTYLQSVLEYNTVIVKVLMP